MNSKEIKCPECKIPIVWITTDGQNMRKGRCPLCSKGFINMGGTTISTPTFSKKS